MPYDSYSIHVDSEIKLLRNIKKFNRLPHVFLFKTGIAVARLTLVNMGVDIEENIENAFIIYNTAQKIFPETSVDYAKALMGESDVRIELAKMGIDSVKNLETAVCRYMIAQNILPKKKRRFRWCFN